MSVLSKCGSFCVCLTKIFKFLTLRWDDDYEWWMNQDSEGNGRVSYLEVIPAVGWCFSSFQDTLSYVSSEKNTVVTNELWWQWQGSVPQIIPLFSRINCWQMQANLAYSVTLLGSELPRFFIPGDRGPWLSDSFIYQNWVYDGWLSQLSQLPSVIRECRYMNFSHSESLPFVKLHYNRNFEAYLPNCRFRLWCHICFVVCLILIHIHSWISCKSLLYEETFRRTCTFPFELAVKWVWIKVKFNQQIWITPSTKFHLRKVL
jgi:hypothetical protein